MSIKVSNGAPQTHGIPQGPRAHNTEHFRQIICDCGCNEMEMVPCAVVSYDPLAVKMLSIANQNKVRCLNCGLYMTFDKENQKWFFSKLEYYPLKSLQP